MIRLLHMGDLDIALPLGAGLATWLVATGAWRAALRWASCFLAAVVLVGGTKVAYLGWGADMTALGFKALSGHATVVTALYPFGAWVLLRRHGNGAACAALGAGLLLGAAVAALLVARAEHSWTEALLGWLLGAAVSAAGVASARDLGRATLLPALWWSLPVVALAGWAMQSAHVGYWMVRLALALSGNSRPYSWDTCG